jgi:tRNA(fMet)-specific endonuclease VapC
MKRRYLLDTNICIDWLNTRHSRIVERLDDIPTDALGMSVVTWGELQFGAAKSRQPTIAQRNLNALAEAVPPLALSIEVARHYGKLRATLERQGVPIGANDLWIAAHALMEDRTLVTNNTREFERVPELAIANWTES